MIAKRQQSRNIHLQVRHLHLVRDLLILFEFLLFLRIDIYETLRLYLLKVILAIKEVIKLIEFYRQTAVKSPLYAELINDLKCELSIITQIIYFYTHRTYISIIKL